MNIPALAPLLLRDTDVARLLGISRRLVWTLTSVGHLPQPVRLGGRAVRWRHSDIVAAVDRLAAGEGAAAKGTGGPPT